jgi:hypothetical protein
VHGDAGSADVAALVAAWPELMEIIEAYDAYCIYNTDESGFIYRMAPSKTFAQRQLQGSKKDKTRITVAFTVNATGTHQLPPLLLGNPPSLDVSRRKRVNS